VYNPESDEKRLHEDIYATSNLEEEEYRSSYRRDFDRLIHSPSFRRLQGKTQLYPGRESDFFRNRLTHSLEVAQIAKSIAIRINHRFMPTSEEGTREAIDLDIVEFAGVAHDLGHPPFGHQGEEALDEMMINHGGFEGNAQTLRLLTRIEKKHSFTFDDYGEDIRIGLNLTSRILASVLKYDKIIPPSTAERQELAGENDIKPVKGYYSCDKEIVASIKDIILNGVEYDQAFKTIECKIMDIADDIAYSTYDLEDGFKAGFFNPFDIVFAKDELIERIANRVNQRTGENLGKDEIRDVLLGVFSTCFELPNLDDADINRQSFFSHHILHMGAAYTTANLLSKDGFARTDFTSKLVGKFIRGIQFEYNQAAPMLSEVQLSPEIRLEVEILKIFNYESQILSPRLKIAEFRGKEIVKKIFTVLADENTNGYLLMPQDYIDLYRLAKPELKKRIICDFIAGMTDNYCIEFYGRLTSENPETIFKPY
jgi:dGTPase